MTRPQDAQQFIGRTAVDSEGSKIGKIGQVYLDEQTGAPLWATVATGMFGTRESFAPIYGSRFEGDQVRLAVSKDLVKDAPNIDDDGHIGESEQEALYQHYAGYLANGQTGAEAGYTDGSDLAGNPAGVRGRDTSGPTTDTAMTRSEERLHVGTENVQAGRARLRKYVVTETVTTRYLSATKKCGWSASRSPRPTATLRYLARLSARKNTKSPCTPSARWWPRKPSRSNGSAWAPRPSLRNSR